MDLFGKNFEEITENDLIMMEEDPVNFESLYIEYKIRFDGNSAELRIDVVQFANGFEEGYLFFGISDNPITIIGIEWNEVNGLKTVLNDILSKKIAPMLSPFPKYHIVPLSDGKYVFIIKILPKPSGIYGIRLHEDMTNRNYRKYEFYSRMDGSKHQMNIEEIVDLIKKKSKGPEKYIEASIHGAALLPTLDDNIYIAIKAVNKSTRPITIIAYGIEIPDENKKILISPIHPKNLVTCSHLPCRLGDGESCRAFLSRNDFERSMEEKGWIYPIKVRSFFDTNDGIFTSNDIELRDIE